MRKGIRPEWQLRSQQSCPKCHSDIPAGATFCLSCKNYTGFHVSDIAPLANTLAFLTALSAALAVFIWYVGFYFDNQIDLKFSSPECDERGAYITVTNEGTRPEQVVSGKAYFLVFRKINTGIYRGKRVFSKGDFELRDFMNYVEFSDNGDTILEKGPAKDSLNYISQWSPVKLERVVQRVDTTPNRQSQRDTLGDIRESLKGATSVIVSHQTQAYVEFITSFKFVPTSGIIETMNSPGDDSSLKNEPIECFYVYTFEIVQLRGAIDRKNLMVKCKCVLLNLPDDQINNP